MTEPQVFVHVLMAFQVVMGMVTRARGGIVDIDRDFLFSLQVFSSILITARSYQLFITYRRRRCRHCQTIFVVRVYIYIKLYMRHHIYQDQSEDRGNGSSFDITTNL